MVPVGEASLFVFWGHHIEADGFEHPVEVLGIENSRRGPMLTVREVTTRSQSMVGKLNVEEIGPTLDDIERFGAE